jgi:hypothetical protein
MTNAVQVKGKEKSSPLDGTKKCFVNRRNIATQPTRKIGKGKALRNGKEYGT